MSAQIAVEAGEAAAEVVEDTVDGVVDVLEVARNNPVTLTLVAFAALTAGAAGGYFFAKRQLREYYEELSRQEIAVAKEFYQGVHKVDEGGEILSPMDVMMERHPEAAQALSEYDGTGGAETPYEHQQDEEQIAKIQAQVEEKVEVKRTNVFVDPDFDYDEELKYRSKDKPYIITFDEFYSSEKDYDQHSLTYYEVDKTLVGSDDKPFDSVEGIVGSENLARFGHGSKDKNTVFVRNDKLEIDYEVTRSTGSYLEEVLGLEAQQDRQSRK